MLKVVTFNIHHGRGWDRWVRLSRPARVLKRIQADVVALQEVDRFRDRTHGSNQAEELAMHLEYDHRFAPAWETGDAGYGIALLSRYPIENYRTILLPRGTDEKEPRIAQAVTLSTGVGDVTLINTHLSTSRSERRAQAGALAEWVNEVRVRYPDIPVIICGDFNGLPSRQGSLSSLFQTVSWDPDRSSREALKASFPTLRPMVKLDYVLATPELEADYQRPHRTWLSRIASDHFPVVASFRRAGASLT